MRHAAIKAGYIKGEDDDAVNEDPLVAEFMVLSSPLASERRAPVASEGRAYLASRRRAPQFSVEWATVNV